MANLLVALLPESKTCDAKYLYYFLQAKKDEVLVPLMQGTANVSLKEQDIATVTVPLPSLSEQGRIVGRIEETASRLQEVSMLRGLARSEAGMLLLSVFHELLGRPSHDWTTLPLGDAVTIGNCQVDPRLPEHRVLPHVSGANMESRTCRLLPVRTAEADGVTSGKYLFAPGTILYSKIRPYLRKAVFADLQGALQRRCVPHSSRKR